MRRMAATRRSKKIHVMKRRILSKILSPRQFDFVRHVAQGNLLQQRVAAICRLVCFGFYVVNVFYVQYFNVDNLFETDIVCSTMNRANVCLTSVVNNVKHRL